MNKEEKQIDITPDISIYKTFKNFDYKPVDAVAEFIDNSTQSFKDQKSMEEIVPKIYIIWIEQEKKLQIIDNCFGVQNSNIDRILQLNTPPKKPDSRNEFGMGVKTAGFWLGDSIKITTRHISQDKTFQFILNLNELPNIAKSNNKINVNEFSKEFFSHEAQKNTQDFSIGDFGTCVEIGNVKKGIMTFNKLCKLTSNFASKYRNDFYDDKVEIRVVMLDDKYIRHDCNSRNKINYISDAKKLEYEQPILKKDEKTNQEIKIEIDMSFIFNEKEYNVKGWIGVLETGSRSQPGLTLFRRGRTIKGDRDDNQYKPKQIYGDAGTFNYQRICGWLHVDDFPVTQQKNDFAWDDGLEDEFIEILKQEIKKKKDEYDIIKIANTKKDKEINLSVDKIINDKNVEEIKESLENDNYFKSVETQICYHENNNIIIFKLKDKEEEFNFELNIEDTKHNQDSIKWLKINRKKDKTYENKNYYEITLNFSLPWFSPFNNDVDNVKQQIIKFAIYFAYAEIKHQKDCSIAYEIREKLNECFLDKNELSKEQN